MPDLTPEQRSFINSSWSQRWDGVLHAQNQVLNWLFAVHGGGIAGLLAYAASKAASCSVKVGLGAFVGGLVLLMIYGVCMFYFEAYHFSKYKHVANAAFNGKATWAEFAAHADATPERYRTCEVLAWLSGILGLVGLISAVVAIV